MPYNTVNDATASVANSIIKELDKTILPYFEQKLEKYLPDYTGQLAGGVTVKEAAANLKATIKELTNVRDTLIERLNSPEFKDLVGYEDTSRWATIKDPIARLESDVSGLDGLIGMVQHGINDLYRGYNAPELAGVSDYELQKSLDKNHPAPHVEAPKAHPRPMSATGDRLRSPEGSPVHKKVTEWHAAHDDVSKTERKVRWNDQVEHGSYVSANYAQKDISWVDGDVGQIRLMGYADDDLKEDAEITDFGSDEIGERGKKRFIDPKSPEFNPNVALDRVIRKEMHGQGSASAIRFGVDSARVDNSRPGQEFSELAKHVGAEKAGHVAGREDEAAFLKSEYPNTKERKAVIAEREKQKVHGENFVPKGSQVLEDGSILKGKLKAPPKS